MNLLDNIIFYRASTFCVENFVESRSSPSRPLIEENTISAIQLLLPASLTRFHPSDPSFLISSATSSLLNWQPPELVDAVFLISIAGSTSSWSSKLKSFYYRTLCLHIIFRCHVFLLLLLLRIKSFGIMHISSSYSKRDYLLSWTLYPHLYAILWIPFSFISIFVYMMTLSWYNQT